MKKIILVLFISIISLSADYKLVLTDVDGNQTEQCVKSYSFSNNLESIANQTGVSKDVYSENEVMTNKVYEGKPIYRKIVTIPDNLKVNSIWTSVAYKNPPVNVEVLIKAEFFGPSFDGMNVRDSNPIWNSTYMLSTTFGYSFIGSERVKGFKNKKVILEYTKTTDVSNTSPNKFQSYLIYKLSSSTNDEVITKDMKNLGVQLLKGYLYDASTNSCTKN